MEGGCVDAYLGLVWKWEGERWQKMGGFSPVNTVNGTLSIFVPVLSSSFHPCFVDFGKAQLFGTAGSSARKGVARSPSSRSPLGDLGMLKLLSGRNSGQKGRKCGQKDQKCLISPSVRRPEQ